jgi:catechol 2,3-dioxygenase-like lactoylglutathione lyase family enzyme
VLTGIDHVALGVQDLDERIAFMTTVLGMMLKRRGTHIPTGGRIAFLADPGTGFKFELVETPDRQLGFMHVAYRADDVSAEHDRLVEQGLQSLRTPVRIKPAKAVSALLKDPSGLEVQVIAYDADSPDL